MAGLLLRPEIPLHSCKRPAIGKFPLIILSGTCQARARSLIFFFFLQKRLCNAAKKALSKIPTKEIQQEDREVQGDGECCAVCIEPYKVTDDLRVLPCRSVYVISQT